MSIDVEKEADAYIAWNETLGYFPTAGEVWLAAKRHAAQVAEPANFCPRCGKRNIGIHTCTPPAEPSGASVDSVARDAALGAAIQRAAGELPAGWEIHICVERDAGTAMIYDPNCDSWDLVDGDCLADHIQHGIDGAIAAMSPTKAGEGES